MLIDKHLQIACAMSVAATLTPKEGSPSCTVIGSWTVFSTKISDVGTCKFETGFLPVIPQPPKDNVCKCYLGFLLNMKNDLNFSKFFCHNDHDVFYTLSLIIWIKNIWKHCQYNSIQYNVKIHRKTRVPESLF